MQKTAEQIRTAGLAALKRELGVAGMIRFLQQFDHGSGDWTAARQTWVERTTLDDIKKAAAKIRRPKDDK
jgi:hypothetical protein